MHLQNLEQGSHSQNHAIERDIGLLANHWRRRMAKKVVPKRL